MKCMFCSCMSGPFQQLKPEELALVDKHRTELFYKKGEILCKQGAFVPNTIFVKEGIVKIYLEEGDQKLILSVEKDGYFIGLPSLFGDRVYHYTAEALSDVQVCQVDINIYRRLLETNPKFGVKVLETANRDTVKLYNRMFSLSQRQINGRFAELLLFLKNKIYESNPFELSIPRWEMAEWIQTSKESISRLIKEFREEGLINMNGSDTVEILDEDRLHQIMKYG